MQPVNQRNNLNLRLDLTLVDNCEVCYTARTQFVFEDVFPRLNNSPSLAGRLTPILDPSIFDETKQEQLWAQAQRDRPRST